MKKKLLLLTLPFMLFSLSACDKPQEEPKDYILENWDAIMDGIAEKGYTYKKHSEEAFLDAETTIITDNVGKYDVHNNKEYSLVDMHQDSDYYYYESYIYFGNEPGKFTEYYREDQYMNYRKSESTYVAGSRSAKIDGRHALMSKPEGIYLDNDKYVTVIDDIHYEYTFDKDRNLVSVFEEYNLVFDEEDEIPGRCHGTVIIEYSNIGTTIVPALSPKVIDSD